MQGEPYRSYREVLTLALERLAAGRAGCDPEGEAGALGGPLPDWPPFPERRRARGLRGRGWRLAILSNSDRALIAASQRRLGVPFDLAVVAEDVGTYKPAHGTGSASSTDDGGRERHVHVGASHFHDIALRTSSD